MNELTTQFHKAKFPEWSPKLQINEIIPGLNPTELQINEIMENFWNCSSFPFLEVDLKMASEDFTKAEKWIEQNQKLFKTHQGTAHLYEKAKKNNTDWFFTLHADGWEEIRIKGDITKVSADLFDTTKIAPGYSDDFKLKLYPDALTELIKKFETKGWFFDMITLKKLKPGGWIQPHRDPVQPAYKKLQNFWIPINHISASVKIWPYGIMPNKVGHLYLFNNADYMHSVYNADNSDRYVLVGMLDLTKTKIDNSYLKKCILEQWYQ